MLRFTKCMSADRAEKYFREALNRSDYYAKQAGIWFGKGAERLGLKGEVEQKDFVSLMRNRVPGTGDKERLTARDNTTREERAFNEVTETWEVKEKANRQTGYDRVQSVPSPGPFTLRQPTT